MGIARPAKWHHSLSWRTKTVTIGNKSLDLKGEHAVPHSTQQPDVPRNKENPVRWLQRRKLRSPLYRWYLSSSLRQLLDELRNAPRRITFAAHELPYQEGIPVHCPEEFFRSGLAYNYQWHCSDCIRGLERLIPGWGSIDTLVACQAFHAGSMYGARASRCTQGETQLGRNPIQLASAKSIPKIS
jgi:hypothetical protein